MLRLLAMTLFGLWASLMVFGRDLSPEEQARLEARRDGKLSVITQLSETVSEAFGMGPKRQGDFVPTLAELRPTPTPRISAPIEGARIQLASARMDSVQEASAQGASVQAASAQGANAQMPLPTPTFAATTVATTRVAHPEKLVAVMTAAQRPTSGPTPEPMPTPAMILREVTASRVNVRSGPSTTNPVLGQVLRADIVRVISPEENGWVKIVIEGDGVEGYMAARFLAEAAQ